MNPPILYWIGLIILALAGLVLLVGVVVLVAWIFWDRWQVVRWYTRRGDARHAHDTERIKTLQSRLTDRSAEMNHLRGLDADCQRSIRMLRQTINQLAAANNKAANDANKNSS